MERIKSVSDLKKIRQGSGSISQATSPVALTDPVIIKVAMATCGIASGAKDTYDYFKQELSRRHINASVSQTGCMSYCYAEPTVEVTLPGHEPVVFGHVNSAKAQEIIDKYIGLHELVDGMIPASYKTV
jgi:NADP-reducing hydrogenase subunit HndB